MKKIITVFCGRVRQQTDGSWRSVGYEDFNGPSVSPGSRARVEAAAIMYKKNPEAIVATFGGGEKFLNNRHTKLTLAKIAKQELVSLGVPSRAIASENLSCNTYQQLLAMAKMATQRQANELYIVSSKYHLSRIRAMTVHLDEIREELKDKKLHLVSAEDVLLENAPSKWQREIEQAYLRPEMKVVIDSENKGTAQIIAGTYRFDKVTRGAREKFYDASK